MFCIRVTAVAALIGLAGCAGSTGGGAAQAQTTQPLPPEPRPVYAAHPGFDTRIYPGDAVMRTWKQASPYEWVGYYLPSPCQTGTTWVGRRESLHAMGWGTAVIFIGEQDWRGLSRDSVAPEAGAQCTTSNLNAGRGAADAARAVTSAKADGFAQGTIIYLDVERVEKISPELKAYVSAWIQGVATDGQYAPGIYAHDNNVAALRAIAGQATKKPVTFWVAKASGFDIMRTPAASGFAWAAVWQGLFNIRETWGDSPLTIDVNLATSPNPSSPNPSGAGGR